MITFLHKFVRTYSQYYLFWRRFLAVWCQNCFHLTFCSSIEHYSFWNPASTASCETAGFAYFFVHSFLDWNDPTLNIFLYFYHHGCSGQHRKVPSIIIGSTEALPILCVRYARWERERDTERERERERKREIDGSDVIIVALKLAMSLHFPMPKIRTIAVSSHFPLPKIALFVSPFTLPVSPLWRWNSRFTLSVAKKFALFVPTLSWMARAARRVIENPRQMIKFCPVLLFFPIEKMNQINTKNYWK